MRRRTFKTSIWPIFSTSILIVLNCFVVAKARAQVSGATLSGTVKDASGAVIPNAQVAIREVART